MEAITCTKCACLSHTTTLLFAADATVKFGLFACTNISMFTSHDVPCDCEQKPLDKDIYPLSGHSPFQTSPNCPAPSLRSSFRDSLGISHSSCHQGFCGALDWHGFTNLVHKPSASPAALTRGRRCGSDGDLCALNRHNDS